MSRRFVFGTNLKMNQTAAESVRFVQHILDSLGPVEGSQFFVIPPFTSLAAVAPLAAGSPLWIGAQNMHWAADGAYTGEISAGMLTGIGVQLVLLGHAERRGLFGETDEAVNRKITAALVAGLNVLLCVGETAAEKDFGVGEETVARQLKIALHGLDGPALPQVQIAYEPVWSIGAGGTPARPDDVAPIAAHLRATLAALHGELAEDVPILYGGSVDPTNAGDFTALPDIDGLFVGRAAWTSDGYRDVLAAGLAGRS